MATKKLLFSPTTLHFKDMIHKITSLLPTDAAKSEVAKIEIDEYEYQAEEPGGVADEESEVQRLGPLHNWARIPQRLYH